MTGYGDDFFAALGVTDDPKAERQVTEVEDWHDQVRARGGQVRNLTYRCPSCGQDATFEFEGIPPTQAELEDLDPCPRCSAGWGDPDEEARLDPDEGELPAGYWVALDEDYWDAGSVAGRPGGRDDEERPR